MEEKLLYIVATMAALVAILALVSWARKRNATVSLAGATGALKNAWPVGLAVVAVGVLVWIYNTDITLAEIAKGATRHWLFIAIAGVAGYVAILFATTRTPCGDVDWPKLAGPLKSVAIWAVAILLILATPIGGWVASIGDTAPSAAKTVQRSTNVRELVIPAGGYSEHVVPPVGHSAMFRGHGYIIHVVFGDGTECIVGDGCPAQGHVLYTYLKDTTGATNTVTYEFIRRM